MNKIPMNHNQRPSFYFNRHKIILVIRWRRPVKGNPAFTSNHPSNMPIWKQHKIEEHQITPNIGQGVSVHKVRKILDISKNPTFLWSRNSPNATIYYCRIFKSKPQPRTSCWFSIKKRVILVWYYFASNTGLLPIK